MMKESRMNRRLFCPLQNEKKNYFSRIQSVFYLEKVVIRFFKVLLLLLTSSQTRVKFSLAISLGTPF